MQVGRGAARNVPGKKQTVVRRQVFLSPRLCRGPVNHRVSFCASSSRQTGVGFLFQNLFKRYKIFHQPSGRRLRRPGKAEYFPQSAKLYACKYFFFSSFFFHWSVQKKKKKTFFFLSCGVLKTPQLRRSTMLTPALKDCLTFG